MRYRIARIGISVFLLVHLAAIATWNMPDCALKERIGSWPAPYMMPTGQWQHWGMFAPEPLRETLALEAQARDARGVVRAYAFPRMAEQPVERAFLGYRHSKFSHNLLGDTAIAYREFAARHVVRSWELPDEAFPVDLDLYYKVWTPAPPGEPAADPNEPPSLRAIQSYRFPTREDVQP